MHAITNVNDTSPLSIPATFSKIAANTVKTKVVRLILVYVVILSTLFNFTVTPLYFVSFRRTFPVTR